MKCSPLERKDFDSDQEYQQWALVTLGVYQAHAEASFSASEAAFAAGLRLKEEGELASVRASNIAKALARFLDKK